MTLKLTAVSRGVPEGRITFVEDLPGANTQERTRQKACKNLQEAVKLGPRLDRKLAKRARDYEVIREPLHILD